MKFDIFKTNAFVSVRAIDAHLSNLSKFGVIKLTYILEDFIIARKKDIALLEFWFCCCCHTITIVYFLTYVKLIGNYF
jgi:hypothetical protein